MATTQQLSKKHLFSPYLKALPAQWYILLHLTPQKALPENEKQNASHDSHLPPSYK
jgi:hypothetical protein